ncbi:MAG: hypothetical protein ACIAQU_05430 [Phycisphaerales bacterium JB064]
MPTTPALADQLRNVVVSPRAELGITRHVFRSGPAYVLRDPVTFKTHRFDPSDYQILSLIDRSTTLGETFRSLVERGLLDADDEERYYQFVVDLHQRNLLSLPLGDGSVLYKRYERRLRAERASKALGIFFLRVPLFNPNRFLDRTIPLFGWLFTMPAFIAWCVLAAASLLIVFARADELASPVLTMFSGGNLVLLWAVLIGLKVVHEFGHAYACKAFGGQVPEMGAFLVLFTPLAYVDATDSWSFTTARRRAIVSLAGVYFESIIGTMALIVWAMTEPSTLNTIAYQTVVLATITTALFNLNPLLRYDAYYLASDLAGIPNLRGRCEAAVAQFAKRLFFGIREDEFGQPVRHPWPLVGFGLAQLGYRVVIMTTIATVIILKFGGMGIALATVIIGMTLGKAVLGLARFISKSEQLADRRLRSATTVATIAVALITGVLFVPLPWPVHAKGVSTFASIETIHAPSDGALRETTLRPGDTFKPGDTMLSLTSTDLDAQHSVRSAEHKAASTQAILASATSPADGVSAQSRVDASGAALAKVDTDLRHMDITAIQPVHVVSTQGLREGSHLRKGEPLMTVGSGSREALVVVPEQIADRLAFSVGDKIACRSPAQPDKQLMATVTSISPSATRHFDSSVAPFASALSIAVNPATGLASEPYIAIRLALPEHAAPPANASIIARLPVRPMTTASVIHRRFSLFMNKVSRGFSER